MLVRISLSLLALGAVQAAANNESVPGSSVLRGSRKLQTTCDNGFPGIGASNSAGDNVCCPLECNQCGGVGCGRNGDRGFGNKECCPNGIVANQGDCADTGSAPCVITDATTPAPTTPAPTTPVPMTPAPTTSAPSDAGSTCSNGIPGIGGTNDNGEVCCPIACNQCGGAGCAQSGAASGLSNKHCCINGVLNNQGNCGSAPCVITNTPAPATVAPTTAAPTTDSPTAPSPTPTTPTPSGNVDSYLITPPTPVMTIPDDPSDCSGGLPEFRYASSSGKVGKGRLYAEGAGCFTMSDIYKWRGFQSSGGVLSPKGPIYELDGNNDPVSTVTSTDPTVTNKWLLEAELYITDGAIFYCKGVEAGGDCDALRIRSTGPNDFYEVRGYGGSLYFEDTVVTSWDTTTQKPQEVHEEGRSYLNCVSEYLTGETCEGQAKNDMGECRMDLINTEAAYLGYLASESYGLTWKVRGFCKDLSNHDVFTSTNVYGNIIGSDIHHNYYGHYSYGHQGGVWTNNKMHHNHQYGFDPHDDSDYLTIANNEVYENVNHGIIASKRCNHVEIYGNTVYSGGAQAAGIFLHRSSDEAEVYNNIIYDMQDAGIAFLESMNAKVYNNDIKTTKFGIRLSLGSAGNHIYSNIFDDASDWGLYTYQGSDDPTSGVSDGRPAYNVFENNKVTGTAGGVKFKNSDNLSVIGNTFTGTEELEFYNAQSILWSGNSLPSSGVCLDNIDSDDGSSIPTSTFTGSSGLPPEC